ncbi:MAG: hypothetical protein M0R32_03135 [Candidatus Cloacimonetes bacterium]|jgi:hypothetical protein|nr:hypothetical protein [Candidatus Cloacimonadota bacterium]
MIDKKSINAKKEALVAQALDTAEGRVALAQAMVEPIRRALEYQAVGRKLLMVDELPQGALARYEKDVRATATVISRRGGVPDQIVEGEEILVPTFEIATNPTIRISEVKARRFYIVDRAQIKAKEAIQKEEDTNIFNAIDAAVPAANTVVSTGGALSVSALNQAFATIEQHDLTVGKVVCHALRYADIRNWGKTVYDEATQKEVLTTGLFGHIWTADIHVSSRVPTTTVFILAPAEYVGAFPVRQDITVLPADDPKKLRLGWVIYEEIGIVIINDYATAKVTVTAA